MTVLLANYRLVESAQYPLLFCAVVLLGGIVLFRAIMLWAYVRLSNRGLSELTSTNRNHPIKVFAIFFVVFSAIDLLYLYLVQYPGTLSPDSIWQMQQILQIEPYSNHHPFWHTIVIQAWIRLGLFLFNDINAAVALYSTVQILFVAAAFSYALTTLYQANVWSVWIVAAALLYAVLPYHIVYSSTMWKDVVFGVAVLIFVVTLFRILKSIGNTPWFHMILLGLSAMGMALWRSNGWIALLASTIIFFFFLRKKFRSVLGLLVCVLVCSWIMKGPVLDRMHVTQPDFVEHFSIPEQQIARVIVEKRALSAEQVELLSKVIDLEAVPEEYLTYISDPIKALLRDKNPEFLEAHKKEFFDLWIELGQTYPSDYIKAWIDQTKGYWNCGYPYGIYVRYVQENYMGILQAERSNAFAATVNRMFTAFDQSILLTPFKSIGLHVWIIIGLFVLNLIFKREEALLSIPLLMIIGTLLVATPVFAEFRYAYAIFTVFPFYLAATIRHAPAFLIKKQKSKKK